MPQQDNRLPVLLFIIFLLWIFPDPAPPSIGYRSRVDAVLAREKRELEVTNSTLYGSFDAEGSRWLNLTGFRESDAFAWDALGKVKEKARQQVVHVLGDEDGWKALDGGVNLNLPFWRNVSGHMRGEWVRSSIDDQVRRPNISLGAILPPDARDFRRSWERNVTGQSGELRVEFTETGQSKEHQGVRMQNVKGEITIKDQNSGGDGWTVDLYGTHFIAAGHVLLTTTSDKFAGMWGLPQFSLTEKLYNALVVGTVERLDKVIEKQRRSDGELLHPYSSVPQGHPENSYTPHCELVAFLQQHPLQQLQSDGKIVAPTTSNIEEMEEELRFPEGSRPYTPPQMRFSALIFSPDCGFVIESKGPPDYTPKDGSHLRGEKWEVYIRSSIDWTVVYGIVLVAQMYLTLIQMKEASTPSTKSRISFYTIGLMSLGDGFIGMAFLPLGMLIDSAFASLMATAFFAFLAVTFFDMRFLLDIWSVQSQERRRLERQRASASPSENVSATATPPDQTPIITAAGADTLPAPVTARQAINSGASPIILPPDQETAPTTATPLTEQARQRRELGAMYGKFYIILLAVTFLSLHATSWYTSPRSIYANTLAFLYLSLWIPQIYRNTMRNCRKALLYKFVIGHSVLRLLPIAYFYCIDSNLLWVHTDRRMFAVLAAWLWIQIWILLVQDVLGPRVGVPKHWLPPAYDYHPLLREDDEESLLPIGFASTASPPSSPSSPRHPSTLANEDKDKDKREESSGKTRALGGGKKIFDCAICMQALEIPVLPAATRREERGSVAATRSAGTMHNMVSRRLYMVTPCRHVFHTRCLEAAMRYRLQCPVCREGLPPL